MLAAGVIAGSALAGAASSALQARAAKKAAAQARADRMRGIQLLEDAMNQEYNSLYGGSATADGMTTGSATQDAWLRALTEAAQAKELQALAINEAVANKTDAEARAELLAQAMAQDKFNNDRAVAIAARQGRRQGVDMTNMLLANAKQQANRRNYLYNTAQLANNNNLQRIAQTMNLNTGSIADQNRQQVQSNYNNAVQNKINLKRQQASLWGNMPTTAGMSTGSAALRGGLSGALGSASALAGAGLLGGQAQATPMVDQALADMPALNSFSMPQTTGTAQIGSNLFTGNPQSTGTWSLANLSRLGY